MPTSRNQFLLECVPGTFIRIPVPQGNDLVKRTMEIDADIPKARDRRRSLMVELRNSNFQRSIRSAAERPRSAESLWERNH